MRFLYLLYSAARYFTRKKCPVCGNTKTRVIDRKYLVTRLLVCNNCRLQFRHPVSGKTSKSFYNFFYRQAGITTNLPTDETLMRYQQTGFAATGRSTDTAKQILETLGGPLNGKSLLDFGCSWGYMAWQFAQCGMQVQGFEIGRDRADFGCKKLNVPIVTSLSEIGNEFDIIFSSHVIEHLTDIREFIELALFKLKPGGYLFMVCPNGSADFKKRSPHGFHRFWGQVHPNLISDEFYKNLFADFPYYISSSPYNMADIANWNQQEQHLFMQGGDELLCIVKKA